MKQLYILIVALAASLFTLAQSKGPAKLYGFKESVSAGKAPSRIVSEDGKDRNEQPRPRHNFFIYLESSSSVVPTEMWIGGQLYSVRVDTVHKTPVERSNYNIPSRPKTMILVPATSKKLVQLTPAPSIAGKGNKKAKKLAAENELVVLYKLNGKLYYNTLKLLTSLPPVAMQ